MADTAKSLEDRVWDALRGVRYPGMSRDIVSFGFVERVEVDGGDVVVRLRMSTHKPEAAEKVKGEVEQAVAGVDGVVRSAVDLHVDKPSGGGAAGPPGGGQQQAVSADPELIPEVEHVVAVASGKGGVGKSTVAANLAIALARGGYAVGLLDADIYGPSMPTMFGIDERPRLQGNRILPFEKYGVKLMSLGFILEVDTPVIWRGPMVMRGIQQMLADVEWGVLDYMVVDLPPGTGDAQLTITQQVPLSSSVIVTTPQDVALIDARKGLAMFRKVNVPVAGIVENMSGFVCPNCGEETEIFKKGGGQRTAEELDTAFLGSVPLDPRIAVGGDSGVPIVVEDDEGPHAEAFQAIARSVVAQVAENAGQPKLSIV